MNYTTSEKDGTDGIKHVDHSAAKEYIVNALPDIIRLDKTFDEFSKATGFDLHGFNDAVIIRKKDLLHLASDGKVADDILKILHSNLLSNQKEFFVKSDSGTHKFTLIPLDNKLNAFGDVNKNRLYAIGRSGFKAKIHSFSA